MLYLFVDHVYSTSASAWPGVLLLVRLLVCVYTAVVYVWLHL